MKYIVFHRESNKFDDIIKDPALKSHYKTKMQYKEHLVLGFVEDDNDSNKLMSYMLLKYGEDMKEFDNLVPDRSPVMGRDYIPERRKNKKSMIYSS